MKTIINEWAEHSAPQVIVKKEIETVIPLWVTKMIAAGVQVKDVKSFRNGMIVYTSIVE